MISRWTQEVLIDLQEWDQDRSYHHESVNSNGIGWVEPGYEGSIDYRIRQLSYSSILTLHTCPRKFELYKKRTEYRTEESEISTITFSFGHVLGEAIQLALNPSVTYEQIVLKMFTTWHADLFSYDEKGAKNFWEAMIALKRFMSLREAGFLNEYELSFPRREHLPVNFPFAITFPDGFSVSRVCGRCTCSHQYDWTKSLYWNVRLQGAKTLISYYVQKLCAGYWLFNCS
jgi:hypothetical protein